MENNLILVKSSNQKRKTIDKVVIHVKDDPNDIDIQASNKFDMEYIKEQLLNIVDHCNITEYASNGTIVIAARYLKNLPNEIVDLILSYVSDEQQSKQSLQNDLYQCSLINKQFYQQTNRLLWHTPVISNTDSLDRFIDCLTNTQILQQTTNPSDSIAMKSEQHLHHHPVPHNILMAKHHVRELNIIGDFWNNTHFSRIMPCLGLLETLIIKRGIETLAFTDELLKYVQLFCPYIITLSLVPTKLKETSCFNDIVQHCHQFRKLELYIHCNNQQQQNGIITSLFSCPSLTTLHLYDGGSHNCNHIKKITMLNIARLHQLTDFSFTGGTMVMPMYMFFSTINMTTTWPLLSSLRIDYCFLLTDALMIPFIESHPHIQSLDLHLTTFSDATLDTISNRLTHITHVRLIHNEIITSAGVYKLVRHCLDLKLANFSWCRNVIDSMIEFFGLGPNGVAVLTLTQMKK